MEKLCLNGAWQMRRIGDAAWSPAQVPGSVFADLLRNGAIEDPYYGDNMLAARAMAENDFEYQRTFDVPETVLHCRKVLLRCEGLDTLAGIYLNDRLLAETDNMHRTYEFDVKPFLLQCGNVLRIEFSSPLQYVRRQQQLTPVPHHETIATLGFSLLRKAHSMFGWDSEPEIPDSGIWRDILLLGITDGRIGDVYVRQIHASGKVEVRAETNLECLGEEAYTVRLEITGPNGDTLSAQEIAVDAKAAPVVTVEKPQLWWPNGYGEHPLYLVKIVMLRDGQEVDSQSFHIGLRTLEVRREPDGWGESFAYVVNGISVFAKGGDFIPEDKFIPLARGEQEEKLLAACAEANYTSIRIWGGGHFPDDSLFDLCDRLGILVWQDLMFACAMYVYTDAFEANILAETRDNVIRLRNHASLMLWCGSNENEWLFDRWEWEKPAKLRTEYLRMYEIALADAVKTYDADRLYWPSSPSSGGSFEDANGGEKGDTHCWTVWHTPTDTYKTYEDHPSRFVSEYGIQSMPCYKTLQAYIPQDALESPNSYLMDFHERNDVIDAGVAKIGYYILQDMPYPKSTEDFVYASQLVQGEALGYGAEAWRRRYGNCMGVLYWQTNDCWPAPTWASIDYQGRWKAAHYYAKRFYAPVLLSAKEKEGSVELWLVNDLPSPAKGEVSWRLLDNQGNLKDEGKQSIAAAGQGAMLLAEVDVSMFSAADRRNTYLSYTLQLEGESAQKRTMLLCKPKHFELIDPQIRTTVGAQGDTLVITLQAAAYAHGIWLDFAGADCVFSDNFFSMDAGESRDITVLPGSLSKPLTTAEAQNSLRVRSVFNIGRV